MSGGAQSLLRWTIGPALVAAVGCGDVRPPADVDAGASADADVEPPDAAPPAPQPTLAVVRFESYPSGGRELTLRVEDLDGAVVPDASASIDVRWSDGTHPAFAVTPVALDPGVTAVLVRGSASPSAQADIVAQIAAFAALRPDGERLAIYRWGEDVAQLANATSDRARLSQLAARFGALAVDAVALDPAAALTSVAAEVRAVGGVAPRYMRAIAVIGADAATRDAVDTQLSSVPIAWVPSDAASPDQAVADASARIDALAAGAHYAITLCGPTDAAIATVSVGDVDGEIAVPLPATLPEQTAGTCTLDDIGEGRRSYTSVIDFVFTPDQRAVYDQRVAEPSELDFDLSLRLAPGEDLVVATAHLRGQGSLFCQRKSYTVNLDGPLERYLMPESAVNEFYLVSMCSDERYIQLHTAYRIGAALGIFPLRFRYVELRVDGVTQGVYLLIEKVMEELRRDNTGVRSVLRRRFSPPDDYVEVKWARDNQDVQAVSDMNNFLAQLAALSGPDLEAAMEARIDVDQYLTFIAAQTIWLNGDYVDEAFFSSTDTLDPAGIARNYYQTVGWDADDLFSGCHYNSDYAFVDPHQIAYCAEATLDHIILGDALMYDRYVDKVEALLDAGLTPADFTAAREATRAAILPWFERPDICAAMIELLQSNPGAIDPVVAQADLSAAIDQLGVALTNRRAFLLDRIAAYRGQ